MSDEQFEPSMEAHSTVTAWQMLRDAREARGLSIAEVAQHLKLTPRQVEAMEAGDLAHLPGPAFARGFVRNYARFLHIDPAHFTSVLEVVRDVPQPINTLPLGNMPGPTRWRFSSLPAFGIAAVLLALAVAGYYYGWFEPRDEEYLADVMGQSVALANSAPPAAAPVVAAPSAQSQPGMQPVDPVAASAIVVAPASPAVDPALAAALAPVASAVVASSAAASAPRAATSSAAASNGAVTLTAATSLTPIPAVPKTAGAPQAQSAALSGPIPKGSRRLHFVFDADAWVEVRDVNDKVVFSRLNSAGSEQDVQGEAPLKVVIGNAPQVRLTVDGQATDLAARTSSNVARLNLP